MTAESGFAERCAILCTGIVIAPACLRHVEESIKRSMVSTVRLQQTGRSSGLFVRRVGSFPRPSWVDTSPAVAHTLLHDFSSRPSATWMRGSLQCNISQRGFSSSVL